MPKEQNNRDSMNNQAHSFPPLEGHHVHTLILGSMPGQASLQAAQYYAHARNAFWPIMLALINNSVASYDDVRTLNYQQRCTLLTENGYAAWDVLASCERPGSLDSNIVRGSEQPNDIASLAQRHPELRCIACNGRTAEALFKRHIQPTLPATATAITATATATEKTTTPSETTLPSNSSNQIRIVPLPSSSPAMARLTLQQKHQLWADGLLG